jgi:hypothetical protein
MSSTQHAFAALLRREPEQSGAHHEKIFVANFAAPTLGTSAQRSAVAKQAAPSRTSTGTTIATAKVN